MNHLHQEPVRGVLFDLGGVIVSFDNRTWTQPLADRANVPVEAFETVALGDLATAFHRGDIAGEQYLQGMNRAFGLDVGFAEFLAGYRDLFALRPKTELLIDDLLQQGIPVGLLSNTNEVHWPWCLQRFPVLSRLTGIVVSHLVHCVKPEERIYHLAASAIGIPPEACVFLDDTQRLADAAQQVGMRGITFADAGHARLDLRHLGLQV